MLCNISKDCKPSGNSTITLPLRLSITSLDLLLRNLSISPKVNCFPASFLKKKRLDVGSLVGMITGPKSKVKKGMLTILKGMIIITTARMKATITRGTRDMGTRDMGIKGTVIAKTSGDREASHQKTTE